MSKVSIVTTLACLARVHDFSLASVVLQASPALRLPPSGMVGLAAEFQRCICSSADTSRSPAPPTRDCPVLPPTLNLTPMLIKTETANEKAICVCNFFGDSCSLFSSCHMGFALGKVRLLCNRGQMLPVHLDTLPPKHTFKD